MGVSNVSSASPKVGGAIHVQTSTTATLPTSVDTTLTGFTGLGYLGEEGIGNDNTASSSSVKAFGGQTVLTSQTDKKDTFTYKLLEVLDVSVLKEVYGAENVSGTLATGITVKANAAELPTKAVVIDLVMRDDVAKRIVCPNAKIVSISTITYKTGDACGYAVTLECTPDASGNTHYEYIKQASSSAS